MQSRSSFTKLTKSLGTQSHVVIFAVVQHNITLLDKMLMDRSDPSSPLYQQWLSYDEVTEITDNRQGSTALREWLDSNSIDILWASRREHYFTARASVATWESVLNAQFYEWQDQHSSEAVAQYTRCTEFEMPAEIAPHVSTIFNTVQTPPVMVNLAPSSVSAPSQFKVDLSNEELVNLLSVNKKKRKQTSAGSKSVKQGEKTPSQSERSLTSQDITVPFLRSFYDIPSTSASSSPRYNQSVIALTTSYFSPADLLQFQQTYGLSEQSAISLGGHTSRDCSGVDCSEGNLDIQYISGISQVSK